MKQPPLISFIVVNWRAEAETARCIDSINLQDTSFPYEVIIFDNESTDDSLSRLSGLGKVFSSKENLGFGVAVNKAANQAKGKYIALINNDAVVDKEWSNAAVAAIEKEKVGIVGGTEYLWDGGRKTSDRHYGIPQIKKRTLLIKQSTDTGLADKQTAYVTASNVLIRAELFAKVGGFDASFFTYYEDLDLCAKILNLGHKVIFVPKMKIWHKNNFSSNRNKRKKYFYIMSNRYKIAGKYFPNKSWRKFLAINLLRDVFRPAIFLPLSYLLSAMNKKFEDKVQVQLGTLDAAIWVIRNKNNIRMQPRPNRFYDYLTSL